MKKFFAAALASMTLAAGFLAASAANAAVVINFVPANGSTENTGASATAQFSFADQGSNVLMTILLTNTTNGSLGLGATAATLVGLAFDVPTSSVLTFTGDAGFTKTWTNVSLPPYGSFDLGVSPPRNSFPGGNPNSGLTAGQSLTVSYVLDTTQSAAAFENNFLAQYQDKVYTAAVRFQQVNKGGGSDKVLGGVDVPTSGVPEPATWAMMITGFGLAGVAIRRRRGALAVA